MKSTIYGLLFIVTMVSFTSCQKEDDSPIITKMFELDAFTGVDLSISGNVTIIQGENQSVEITGRQETVNEINKSVDNGLWDISLPNHYNKSYDKMDIVIVSNNIEKLLLSGSGNIDAEIETSTLTSKISGSGNITVFGLVDIFTHQTSGSGKLNGFELETNNAEIGISGSGEAKVYAKSNLDITISGSGNVYYKGTPTITKKITGSGRVINSN